DLSGPGGAVKGNPAYEVMGVTRHWRFKREKMEELIRRGRVVQTSPGAVPQYKRYLDEMPRMPVQNIWTDIPVVKVEHRKRPPTMRGNSVRVASSDQKRNTADVTPQPPRSRGPCR